MGIGVYIELGGINTLTSPDSIVDLYATFNQAESQNKSDNIKFGLRQRMKSGKTMLNHSQFLGYTKGPDGVLQVVPEEAEIVQKIFDLYVQGNGVRKIKRYLEEHGIARERILLEGEIPSPIHPPQGCRFCTRCKYADERCCAEEPPLVDVGNEHLVACHRVAGG